MTKDHGPTIKNDETFEKLRDKGMSKEKAARISNAQANDDMQPWKKGGEMPKYEERTKDELYNQAGNVGIEGRSDMTKDDLIEALRSH